MAALAVAATAAVLWWRLRAAPATPRSSAPPPAPVTEPAAIARLADWVPRPPASVVTRAVAYVWAAPLTAAGLVLGALSRTPPRVHDGVVRFDDARGLGGRMLRWRGFAAATLGHVIIATGSPGDRLLRHELVHVRQAERLGPLFVPLYLAGLVRYGYRRNPFERAAYAAADGTPAA
jgi:hypothetical protein